MWKERIMRHKFASVILLILALSVSGAFADITISSRTEEILDELFYNRLIYASEEDGSKALKMLESWVEGKKDEMETLPEADRLVLTNMIDCVWYNQKVRISGTKKEMIQHLSAQTKVSNAYMKEHKSEKMSKWLYLSTGSVTAVYMALEPLKTAMTYGYGVRDMFQTAVDLDPKFSYAQRNLAQWYYYCPGFLGGSKKKARELFQTAYKNSKNTADTYETAILMSQICYEDKDSGKCESYLKEASDLVSPKSAYIAFIRKINKEGESVFKYHNHKADK